MKTYLLIILILVGFKLSAQTYHPFPTKNTIWTQMSPNPNYFEHDIFHIYALKNNDTTINGKLYHKLYNSEDTTFTERELCGGIREENKKVYFYALTSLTYPREQTIPGTESLLYDFSLKVGDIITSDNFRLAGPNLFVSNIDSILIGTEYRKSITFYNLPYLTWVEGIGSLIGIITMNGLYPTSGGSMNNLICFRQNNEILYHNSEYDDCFYKNDYNSINDNKLVKEITIEPNPVLATCKVSYSASYYRLEIVNLFGIVVHKYDVIGQTSTIVDRQGLPSGIYFIKLNGRGVVSETIKAIFN
ncbi:MAG TPA: T9SS type A sorting domain-containing protein [Prolixibacteraceae bacterium]|jgi:hypothetical protein